jgi:hypothetical protein
LIGGISDQLENSVQGYFLTLTLVLKKFRDNVDIEKFIKFIVDETGLSKAQTKSERNGLALGRLLILSTFVEANMFTPSKIHKATAISSLISTFFFEISRLWNQQIKFRESILKVIEKVIRSTAETNPEMLQNIVSPLAQYCLLKPTGDLTNTSDVLKYRVMNDAD